MARIRTIKPDFWTDETLTECSLSARLLFIGTWNFCDDEGNLENSHIQLKSKIFPVDNLDVRPLIQELVTHGLLNEYSVSGKKYLNIKGFKKHQLINRPSKPQFPLYESSLNTHGALTEHSLQKGREGKGMEGSVVSPSALVELASQSQPVVDEPLPLFSENQTTQVTVVDTQEVKPESLIFDHWKSVMNHPRAVLAEKTKQLLKARLKEGFTVESCISAINGCAKSPHHMGFNDRQTRYDDIGLIFRNGEITNRFIGYDEQLPTINTERMKLSAAGRSTAASLDDWIVDGSGGDSQPGEIVVEGEVIERF